MTLSLAKVIYGAMVEWYCPDNWSTGIKNVPKCWAIHHKSHAHCYNPCYQYPITHGCTYFKSHWHISSIQSIIYVWLHPFILKLSVCCLHQLSVSQTRRSEFSSKPKYNIAVCVIVKLAMLKGQPTFMISLKSD